MPKPPRAFSPLTTTREAPVERTRGPRPAKRAFIPGSPTTSPIIKAFTVPAIRELLAIKRISTQRNAEKRIKEKRHGREECEQTILTNLLCRIPYPLLLSFSLPLRPLRPLRLLFIQSY